MVALSHCIGSLTLFLTGVGGFRLIKDSGSDVGQRGKKPNVVLFIIDDFGWSDVSYHTSGGHFQTPNIDRLSEEGVRFERFYVQPQCSPTRSTALTGRYSWKMGMQHFTTLFPGSTAGLPGLVPTIADYFKESGYQTHAIGKWHLGTGKREQLPTAKGFDSFLGIMGGRLEYFNRTTTSDFFYPDNADLESPLGPEGAGLDFWKSSNPDEWIPLPPHNQPPSGSDYIEDVLEQAAIEVFEDAARPAAKPFFIFFTPLLLHEPLEPPRMYPQCADVLPAMPVEGKDTGTPINRTALCNMAARLDEHFLAFETKLRQLKLWEDTLIFAMSDNGGMIGFDTDFPASASCNWPLRGSKTTLFEGGIRVPAFIIGGALPARARSLKLDTFMFATDVLPTLIAFARLRPSERLLKFETDGVNQWGNIVGRGNESAAAAQREVVINIGVNPMGGFPAFVPGFGPDEAPTGVLNFSSIIIWPHKLILAEAYIEFSISQDPFPRSGRYSCDADGYVYHEEQEGSEAFLLEVPGGLTKDSTYPRTGGRTLKAWLFNVEDDANEEKNLLITGSSKEQEKEKALEMVARLEYHAQIRNGYVPDQSNRVKSNGNPACYNWTWYPGPWERNACKNSPSQQEYQNFGALSTLAKLWQAL